MIRQILKLLWNRKRSNAMMILEIFISFMVVFAVVVAATYCWDNYRRPLGFQHQDVWTIALDAKEGGREGDPSLRTRVRQVLTELRAMDEVVAVTPLSFTPYEGSNSNGNRQFNGREVFFEFNDAGDDLPQVLGVELIRGRWFNKSDNGLAYRPLVIDSDAAREVFGSEDPIGKQLDLEEESPRKGIIVGVIRDFRKGGELSTPSAYSFERINLDATDNSSLDADGRENQLARLPRNIVIRLQPGTTAAFEEKLIARLQSAAPEWSFEIRPVEQMRAKDLRLRLIPLIVGAILAAFMSAMVALGLLGVLWQNITQRTREMGLRRAVGASASLVQKQVVGELVALTSFSLLLGTLVVVQLHLTGFIDFLPRSVFVAGLMISLALIYLLTTACALYPSWLATFLQEKELETMTVSTSRTSSRLPIWIDAVRPLNHFRPPVQKGCVVYLKTTFCRERGRTSRFRTASRRFLRG